MRTKIIAAIAMLALLVAGCGGVLLQQGDDAAATYDDELTISYYGYMPVADLIGIATALGLDPETVFDGDAFAFALESVRNDTEATVDNIDDYKAYIKPYLKSGVVSIPYGVLVFLGMSTADQKTAIEAAKDPGYQPGTSAVLDAINDYELEAKMTFEDLVTCLVTFTDATVDRYGDLNGGVATKIVLTGVSERKAVDLIAAADVERLIEEAVAKATEGMYTQEELDEAVADAVQIVIDSYAGWSSPAEVAAAIADAVAKATEGMYTQAQVDKLIADATAGMYTQAQLDEAVAKAKASAEGNNAYLYICIVLAIALVALAIFLVFKMRKERAAAINAQKPEEPQA